MTHFAKKHLGQNFLIDPNILRKIVNTIDLQPDDIVVEIGPGQGALTAYLLESGAEIHAIEYDKDLIPLLEDKFSEFSNFHLNHADALEFYYSSVADREIRVVGNIPYNISSPILFRLFDFADSIQDITFLVQKEIAGRICANYGNKEYGILSVMSQFYGVPQRHFDVSAKVFRPVPKVASSIFSIKIKADLPGKTFRENFKKIVKTAFNQRRKTLRNSLKEMLGNFSFECPVDLSLRAEQIALEEFEKLTRFYEELEK